MNYLTFIEDNISKIGTIKGLEMAKILEIEDYFQLKLPTAYKEFLCNFGETSGNLLSSYYMTYPALMDNKNDAIEMLNFDDRKLKNEKPKLKENYFFFGQWQGYNFFFFECRDNENPPIKLLNDSLEIIDYKKSFTDFLIEDGINNL
ncbi:SMI1/KNR4 family protein [Nubsella zeaxanthinifaciens]|uniref:SMI1/KNR4 family protein n=1 Tax=Nubsella zeaxanthinifaciens TaxID=392412 RepID=UPI000DE3690D|nr:SMI1/KNR4 family protein [Nubsella zeaxanthinifaciens]